MRKKRLFDFPFKIGTTSMVFGEGLLENVRRLSPLVDYVEIVLFRTPDLHNLPTALEVRELKKIGAGEGIGYTVHLPASLEPASTDQNLRDESLITIRETCRRLEDLDPAHFILHLPFSPPTLVPVPGFYFKAKDPAGEWNGWSTRAGEALNALRTVRPYPETLLVENINYSPRFLETFLKEGLCRLCLDLGHLLLGRETVLSHLREYDGHIQEIHLHGVNGYDEHLSLAHLPVERLQKWLAFLKESDYRKLITLELFSPEELQESLDILSWLWAT
jgi:sugar phosphate isomerase/epimerase